MAEASGDAGGHCLRGPPLQDMMGFKPLTHGWDMNQKYTSNLLTN
jgi:hypothetical protein